MGVLDEWKAERERHPFFGEGLSESEISEIWNRSASTYETPLNGIPERIVAQLVSDGMVSRDDTVLDIGCGPGTFGMLFAPAAKRVTCLDSSPVMIERLDRRIPAGQGNVSTVCADWTRYCCEDSFDVVFSSLCPPLNCPEGILGMERVARKRCAYVSSMNDDRGSIHMEIWKRFGRDYTFNGYNTRYPFRFLVESGRSPAMTEYSAFVPVTETVDDAVSREVSMFSTYMDVDDFRRGIIRDVVESRSEDGYVHSDGAKKVGLLVWTPRHD